VLDCGDWTRVICFFAHPDDAELSCFGTLAMLAARGVPVRVVTATTGSRSNSARGRSRLEEARAAAALIGAESATLALEDGAVLNDADAISRFESAIDEFQPTLLITHYPQRNGSGHQDHTAVSEMATSAGLRAPTVTHIFHSEPPTPATGFDPHIYVDVTDTMDLKLRALELYAGESAKRYMTEATIRGRAAWWALNSGSPVTGPGVACEAFRVVRARIDLNGPRGR
jgi:LmbE family N-acetylglucosaminyl deacetylase